MNYAYLFAAILCEVVATSALKTADGFSRLWPSVVVILGYGLAFYCLSLAMRSIPVGIAYAIWSGIGIVLIALIGWLVYRQPLDMPAILGMALIMAGVLVINLGILGHTVGQDQHHVIGRGIPIHADHVVTQAGRAFCHFL